MQLTDHLELGPSVCFLCELSPPEGTGPHIDTLRTFFPTAPTHLEGRKYVCHACVESLARKLGWASPGESADLEQQIAHLNSRAEKLVDELEARDGFKAAVERVAAFVEKPADHPAPAKKKPAGKA